MRPQVPVVLLTDYDLSEADYEHNLGHERFMGEQPGQTPPIMPARGMHVALMPKLQRVRQQPCSTDCTQLQLPLLSLSAAPGPSPHPSPLTPDAACRRPPGINLTRVEASLASIIDEGQEAVVVSAQQPLSRHKAVAAALWKARRSRTEAADGGMSECTVARGELMDDHRQRG